MSYFSGQDIALGVIAVPLLTAVSFGLAAVAGQPGFGFLGTAVGLAGLGAALAMSNILTVVLPYPMDKRAGSPMRQAAQGYASCQFLGVLGSLGGVAIAVHPGDHRHRAHQRGSGRGPDAGAPAVRRRVRPRAGLAGVRIAAGAAEGRLPELCQVAIAQQAVVNPEPGPPGPEIRPAELTSA